MLLSKMSEEDKRTFCFDPRSIDWKKYMVNYCLGVKQFVLKEDIAELPRARLALLRLVSVAFVICVVVATIYIMLLLLLFVFCYYI